jgi:hypothetical protein
MTRQDNSQRQDETRRQCNVQLPASLIEDLKREGHRLTEHSRRGFSDLLTACARYGWAAYKRGELVIERQPVALYYRLVVCDEQMDTTRTQETAVEDEG